MTVAAILFDCDGVLVDSEIVGLTEVAALLRGHGFDWGEKDLISNFTGMRADQFAADLRHEYGRVLGRPPSDDEFTALFEALLQTRRGQRDKMTIVQGAMESVAAAHDNERIAMAVASSSAQHFLDDKISRYGFGPYFGEHIYSADHVAHGKPAPDIFHFAAEKVGYSAGQCVVIEDSPHGVVAGKASGAIVWGFTGASHCLPDHADRLYAAGADEIVNDHSALAQLIASIGQN